MNKPYLYLIGLSLFAFLAISGCDKEKSKSKDEQELEQLYLKIKALAESSTCGSTTNYELKFIAIGSKACGGPTGYLGYSTSIDTKEFEDLVDKYTDLQNNYNKRWNIMSTCEALLPPSSVKCENGKPVLVYENYNR